MAKHGDDNHYSLQRAFMRDNFIDESENLNSIYHIILCNLYVLSSRNCRHLLELFHEFLHHHHETLQ